MMPIFSSDDVPDTGVTPDRAETQLLTRSGERYRDRYNNIWEVLCVVECSYPYPNTFVFYQAVHDNVSKGMCAVQIEGVFHDMHWRV